MFVDYKKMVIFVMYQIIHKISKIKYLRNVKELIILNELIIMTIYRSKIDHWLWILILAVIFGCEIVPLLLVPEFDLKLFLTMLVSIIIPLALIVNIYTATYYVVDEDTLTLRVKSGVFVDSKYDISKITSIKETHTWLSSPALSLDRLEITISERRKVVISPKYKTQFIEHLLELNPNIKVG